MMICYEAPLRVLSVLHYPVYGGPQNRNAIVASLLRSRGVATTALLPNEASAAAARLRATGMPVVQIPLSRVRNSLAPRPLIDLARQFVGNVRDIRRVIREHDIDVVVLNGLVNPHASFAASREGIPVVWQILDSFPPAAVKLAMRPLLNRYADVIMCTGTRVARDHMGRNWAAQGVVLFHPPVDMDKFRPDSRIRAAARQELGFTEADFVVGNVANLNPMKGHVTFVRAAAIVKSELKNAKFVILGQRYPHRQSYTEGIIREAARLGLAVGKDFRIIDPGQRVAELAQSFDLYWMTSEPRSEGISTAAQEAMALGLPVVSTEAGSMREIVLDGRTGFMAGPRDYANVAVHTLRLARNDSLRAEISAACRAFAEERFDATICASTHLRAYYAALEGAR